MLLTSDGGIVLMKRSRGTVEAAGCWDILGGHPEPRNVSILTEVRI